MPHGRACLRGVTSRVTCLSLPPVLWVTRTPGDPPGTQRCRNPKGSETRQAKKPAFPKRGERAAAREDRCLAWPCEVRELARCVLLAAKSGEEHTRAVHLGGLGG